MEPPIQREPPTQDEWMFFDGHPRELAVYEAARRKILAAFPGTDIHVHKTQITFRTRYDYAYAWLPFRKVKGRPEHYLLLSFGLDRPVYDPRIAETVQARPGRWIHHMVAVTPGAVDEQMMGWLAQAYDFSLTHRRGGPKGGKPREVDHG